MIRSLITASAVALMAMTAVAPGAATAQETGPSGLPLPRFVSLKSDRINVRRGPGQNYDVAFIFVRAGLPVEITQEFDNWRKVRDSDGEEGWIFHSLLSGTRTALVTPWADTEQAEAHASAASSAAVVAYLGPKVLVSVAACTGKWCEIGIKGVDGWIEQDKLWGVYPGETFGD